MDKLSNVSNVYISRYAKIKISVKLNYMTINIEKRPLKLTNRQQFYMACSTNRFHVPLRLFCNRSQMKSKCDKTKALNLEVICMVNKNTDHGKFRGGGVVDLFFTTILTLFDVRFS